MNPIISSDVPDGWVSKQAPGTPAILEALFFMIAKDLTESTPYKSARRWIDATDKELTEWYTFWLTGEVHPDVLAATEQVGK